MGKTMSVIEIPEISIDHITKNDFQKLMYSDISYLIVYKSSNDLLEFFIRFFVGLDSDNKELATEDSLKILDSGFSHDFLMLCNFDTLLAKAKRFC